MRTKSPKPACARTTISIPHELKEKMNAFEQVHYVNWSAIFQEAAALYMAEQQFLRDELPEDTETIENPSKNDGSYSNAGSPTYMVGPVSTGAMANNDAVSQWNDLSENDVSYRCPRCRRLQMDACPACKAHQENS